MNPEPGPVHPGPPMDIFEAAADLENGVSTLHAILNTRDRDALHRSLEMSLSQTPLHVAARLGNLKFVREVLRLCPKLALKHNQEGFLPCHLAAQNQKYRILLYMLRFNPNLVYMPCQVGKTVLHIAMDDPKAPDVEFFTELLNWDHLACASKNFEGQTFLHSVFSLDAVDKPNRMVLFLDERWTLNERMSPQRKAKILDEKRMILNMVDYNGNTVIHSAARAGHVNVLMRFIKHGADIERFNFNGQSPMDLMAGASFISNRYHQYLSERTASRDISFLTSLSIKLSFIFKPVLSFKRDLTTDRMSLFVAFIAMVVSICCISMAAPPGGVMVADFETSKDYYANGNHETNKGRNIPGKAVASTPAFSFMRICNSLLFFICMILGAIVMSIEKKFGLLVVLVVVLFCGLQYLSWVSIVAFHWGFAVATGILLLIALIFIMLFGCFEEYSLEQERVKNEIVEEIRAGNPDNDD